MNIEISEEQFERLLKLVYLGNVMINDTRKETKEDPRLKEYDEIEEKFLRLAHEKGDVDLVQFDIKTGKFHPALALIEDEEMNAFIDRYIDDIFWEELAARLAERDVWEEIGEEVMSAIEDKEKARLYSEAESKYYREFEESGVDNLRIFPALVPDGKVH